MAWVKTIISEYAIGTDTESGNPICIHRKQSKWLGEYAWIITKENWEAIGKLMNWKTNEE